MKDREGFIFTICVILAIMVVILGAVAFQGCSSSRIQISSEVLDG